MGLIKHSAAAVSVAICAVLCAPAVADIWVFDPSVTLDQRLDDNYYLLQPRESSLSATRGIAELGVSREASDYVLKGLARVDALFTTNTDVGEEDLDSNFLLGLDARRRTARSRYGVLLNFKQDTPSRDIAADISDNEAIAEDTGPLVSQSLSSNVARDDITIEPSFEYDISRRLQFNADASFTDVSHALPNAQDVIFERYEGLYDIANQDNIKCSSLQAVDEDGEPVFVPVNDEEGNQTFDGNGNPVRRPVYVQETDNQGEPVFNSEGKPVYVQRPRLSYNQVTAEERCVGVFSPNNELDDFQEAELELGLRFKLTPITTLTTAVSYSHFTSQVLASSRVEFGENFIDDPDIRQIRRIPRRDLVSTTNKLTLGYERFLTSTLQFVLQGGVYFNTSDDSDTYRAGEDTLKKVGPGPDAADVEAPEVGKTDEDGWLASTSLTYDAGATRYTARFAVDVLPSSAGAQVETNELTGEMRRVVSPRMIFTLRGRAFEPDRLGAKADDKFARRFISFEPRVQWRYSRNWTVSAAYRYRRQKAKVDTFSAESNAILLAIKYTPPSELRDTARANGL